MADPKQEQRDTFRAEDPATGPLTTDQGVVVEHADDSHRAGERGPARDAAHHHVADVGPGAPRSDRTMQGFGVHTFRFVDATGMGRPCGPPRRRR
ncbi:hypothetical protein [Streptomyces syringium]|uniref:hypothetical protein n=1 Tax=Streptomyces syringium TaxID=76729 RepID=UPI0033B1765E